MAGGKKMITSEFCCCRCGAKGMPIARKQSKQREKGHLKKLWCIHCKDEVNHVEIRPFDDYSYQDFLEDFNEGIYKEEAYNVNEQNV